MSDTEERTPLRSYMPIIKKVYGITQKLSSLTLPPSVINSFNKIGIGFDNSELVVDGCSKYYVIFQNGVKEISFNAKTMDDMKVFSTLTPEEELIVQTKKINPTTIICRIEPKSKLQTSIDSILTSLTPEQRKRPGFSLEMLMNKRFLKRYIVIPELIDKKQPAFRLLRLSPEIQTKIPTILTNIAKIICLNRNFEITTTAYLICALNCTFNQTYFKDPHQKDQLIGTCFNYFMENIEDSASVAIILLYVVARNSMFNKIDFFTEFFRIAPAFSNMSLENMHLLVNSFTANEIAIEASAEFVYRAIKQSVADIEDKETRATQFIEKLAAFVEKSETLLKGSTFAQKIKELINLDNTLSGKKGLFEFLLLCNTSSCEIKESEKKENSVLQDLDRAGDELESKQHCERDGEKSAVIREGENVTAVIAEKRGNGILQNVMGAIGEEFEPKHKKARQC